MKLKTARRIVERNKVGYIRATDEFEEDRTPAQKALIKKVEAAKRRIINEKARKDRTNSKIG